MDGMDNEYKALRDEIVKRIELRQQIVIATATIAGLFLGIGIKEDTPLVVLIYPPIAIFLALAWIQTDVRIGQLGFFIRKYKEPETGFHWEKWLQERRIETEQEGKRLPSWRTITKSYCGVVLSTQGMALMIGATKFYITMKNSPQANEILSIGKIRLVQNSSTEWIGKPGWPIITLWGILMAANIFSIIYVWRAIRTCRTRELETITPDGFKNEHKEEQ